jgi:hypothetical protein
MIRKERVAMPFWSMAPCRSAKDNNSFSYHDSTSVTDTSLPISRRKANVDAAPQLGILDTSFESVFSKQNPKRAKLKNINGSTIERIGIFPYQDIGAQHALKYWLASSPHIKIH